MKRSVFQVSTDGYQLRRLGPETWRVVSPSGASYIVQPEAGTCTCPDAAARGHRRACKHLRAMWSLLRLIPDLDGKT